jgi:hypothetical protein
MIAVELEVEHAVTTNATTKATMQTAAFTDVLRTVVRLTPRRLGATCQVSRKRCASGHSTSLIAHHSPLASIHG